MKKTVARATAGLCLILLNVLLQACETAAPSTAVSSEDQVNAIARQMYCPICENVPLDVCDTEACSDWRALIRQKLEEGWSEEQIKVYFAEQYGDQVMAEPPAQGFNWLAYIIPPVVFVAGAFLLLNVLKRMRQPQTHPSAPFAAPSTPDDKYARRLEEELKQRER